MCNVKLYKALVVRVVRFIGWTHFVALLLATIYYNRDTNAPVPRWDTRCIERSELEKYPQPQIVLFTRRGLV